MAELRWGAVTDSGRVRDDNEDTFVTEPMIFAVADGMGGHQAGEVASALAATTLRDRLAAGASSVDVVLAAVLEANAAIFQTAHHNAAQRGMGTTLTALAVLPADDDRPEQFALVNVGDSRVYLLRGGELTRATVDHSYVQELLATGHITETEARNHPRRNIVTRALGIEPTVRVDSWLLPVVRGDRFVLCSDGLVDEVDDFDIHTILDDHVEDPQAAAAALVAAAVANGGRDNVTVVVIDVLAGVEPHGLDALHDQDATVMLTRPPLEIDSDPITDQVPVVEGAPESAMKRQMRRQLNTGTFLLFLLAAVVLTVIVTLIAVAVSNSDGDPSPPTTTSSTTTTPSSTTSSTTSTTSTTVAPTTTNSTNTTAAGTGTLAP